ncbi:MAG TPA: heavy-metal-associated domain-containing protein [Acidimicrobiales bacterium]|jgi:copper chaperone CopZ
MTTTVLHVEGMTCEHCVMAVTRELVSLGGVERVRVDLEAGSVEVDADGPLDPVAAAAAIEEAGYELVPPSMAGP